MSKPLIVANWKMNPATFREARHLFEATRKAAEGAKRVSVVVAPPTIFLRELHAAYKGKLVTLAAQDISGALDGAHTGETSLSQAKEAGASYVIVGHSERRAAGETNEGTMKKVAAAVEEKVIPILCVGEEHRGSSGEHLDLIREELRAGFAAVAPGKLARVIVAYEPIWTIGGEAMMKPRDMHEMAIFIRKTVVSLHGEAARALKIIYGGAATESNAPDMLTHGDVSGLLVGHVSWNPPRFQALLENLSKRA